MLRERMKLLADGATEAEIPGRDRQDEIGLMAEAVQVFRGNENRTCSSGSPLRSQPQSRRPRTAGPRHPAQCRTARTRTRDPFSRRRPAAALRRRPRLAHRHHVCPRTSTRCATTSTTRSASSTKRCCAVGVQHARQSMPAPTKSALRPMRSPSAPNSRPPPSRKRLPRSKRSPRR